MTLQLRLWDLAGSGQPAGTRLREARRRRAWTQARLARAMGTSRSTLSRLESGRLAVTLDDVVRAAQALHLQVADLLGTSRTYPHRAVPASRDASWRWSRAIPPLPAAATAEFVAMGGSLRALRAAQEGRQPLTAGQARILVSLGVAIALPGDASGLRSPVQSLGLGTGSPE